MKTRQLQALQQRSTSVKLTFLLASCVIASLMFINISQKANAAPVTGFDAGKIIDDVVFTNNQSMNAEQIQIFLNSKVPTCDTWGTQPSEFGGGTRAQWGTARGYPPPYTCLKDYSENGVSSAQIIYNLSQQYQINPQVFIVLLQKEQALVTDTWPLSTQYKTATGYGCPDTAACDAQYYGFTNQLTWSAKMFRAILNNNPGWYTPYILGDNYIRWNPNSACGGSTVNIQNRSTQALYNYTPYQPNQSALDAGYGLGDSCGAYGNRNFYLYFTDWFGSTKAPAYGWIPSSQYAYTDDTKTTPTGLSSLKPGQRVYVGFTAKNMGNTTWVNTGANPVRVGTTHPLGRQSPFADSTWIGPSRPVTMKESSVAPGQTATFEFWIKAPESSQSNFKEYFSLLSEGNLWMPDPGLYYDISVQPANYSWQPTSQYAFMDATKSSATGLMNLEPGQRKYVGLTAKNTGNTTWVNTGANPIHVGTTHSTDRQSPFADSTWISPSRPVTMKESSVAPGQTATFEFWIKAPASQPGSFNDYFNLVIEGKNWLYDVGLNYSSSVVTPRYTWGLTSQYAYTDDTKSTPIGLYNLSPNQTAYVGFTAMNAGNVTWHNDGANPIDVGTTNPYDRSSVLCSSGWLGCNRPARMKESSVAPGQTATFEFWIKAPATSGAYLTYFNLVSEGLSWMNNIGFNYSISVK